MRALSSITVMMLVMLPALRAAADDVEGLLKTLQAVGPKGAGHREATRAWQELARADASQLPAILAGLDDANPLAANWIRAAVDTIAERELRGGGKLPAAELERFVLARQHAPRARRLAFEWLARVDRSAPGRLIPKMLDDPSLEIRRDAVARLIGDATQVAQRSEPAKALPLYRRALTAARDLDQIRLLAERLRKAGQTVDLPRHFGFLVRWKAIGPFDNTGEKGYDVAYPPEREIDLSASYDGKQGKVQWIEYVTSDDYGKVDFDQIFGEQKGVIAYATAEFVSQKQQEVDFRVTSFNAVKLWLGGRLIDEHNVYHAGSQMDQYICRAVLTPGRNVILIKVCQNEQTQSWARKWYFQLRICDEIGGAILSSE